MYEADVITIRLHYKRECQMPVEELLRLGASAQMVSEGSHRRVLLLCPNCQGKYGTFECPICKGTGHSEDRNPFPIWARDVLELHGYKFDDFNTDYIMRVRGRNDRESASLAEKERVWLVRVTNIIRCRRPFLRFLRGLLLFRWFSRNGLNERPCIRLLAGADVTKCAPWSRISHKAIVSENEYDSEFEALDRKKEKDVF